MSQLSDLDTKNGPVSPAKKHTGPLSNHLQGAQMTSHQGYIPTADTAEHDAIQERLDSDLYMFRAGWEACLKTYPPCDHVHPAVAESVRRMFGDWAGADAAHRASVTRFRAWHEERRQEVTEHQRAA